VKIRINRIQKSKQQLRLSDLKAGDNAHIEGFEDDEASLVRLRDMGLHNGIALRVIKFAPLGDPIEIKIHEFYVSLRKSLAKRIFIKRKQKVIREKICFQCLK
jgi:Fe2+ transport system protein FeoA